MFRCYESSRTKVSGRTSNNLYLQLKWDLIDYENHRYNIRTAKHFIDNKAPLTYSHLYYRPKKLQLELERFCTIQRMNKSLMQRLATIQRQGAWIDNKNFHEIKSLNTWKRQQEMIELAYNNQTMLTRLLDCHTTYNRHKIGDEYLVYQKHKANIQKFPKDWRNIVQRIKRMKKQIKEMVIAMRTGNYKPEMEQRLRNMVLEREALQLQKEEKAAKAAAKAEEEKHIEREKRFLAQQEQRKERARRAEESKKWRGAREERLRLLKEELEERERSVAEAARRATDIKEKRREENAKKLQDWKAQKTIESELRMREEEERKKLEKEKKKKLKRIEKRARDDCREDVKEKLAVGEISSGTETSLKSPTDEETVESKSSSILSDFAKDEGRSSKDEESSEVTEDIEDDSKVTHENELETLSRSDFSRKSEDSETESFVSTTSKITTGSTRESEPEQDNARSTDEWHSDESEEGETIEVLSSLDKLSGIEKTVEDDQEKPVEDSGRPMSEELDEMSAKQTSQEPDDQDYDDSFQSTSGNLESIEPKKAGADQKSDLTENLDADKNSTENVGDEELENESEKDTKSDHQKKK